MSEHDEHDDLARNVFGAVAFLLTGAIIGLVLSPWVPDTKEAIANVILGNVLAWPAIILTYHYGSSSGSRTKDRALASAATEDKA